MPHPLDPILNPRTLAVVGASNDPEKRGYRAIKTLLADGYQGKILPINPKAKEILGLACYPSLDAVPGDIDLALICLPARATAEIVEACGRRGAKGALLLAGGFSEASEEGRQLEDKIVAIAREHGLRLIGPNTNGMFSARYDCNAIAWFDIPRGPAAMLANSANVMLSLLTEAQSHGYFGFSTMLSVGNQSDIQFHGISGSAGAGRRHPRDRLVYRRLQERPRVLRERATGQPAQADRHVQGGPYLRGRQRREIA